MKAISKIFKSIANFFKNPKVKFWLISMAVVIIVSVSVMSVVMLTSHVEYSKKLRPYAQDIVSIEVVNSNGKKELKFDREAGAEEAINKILEKLYAGGKTNRFSQFINGEANGSETVSYNNVSTSTMGSTYILIRFNVEAEHKYTITRPRGSSYVIGAYDPNYGEGVQNPYPSTWEYNNQSVVNAIYIPLNNKNSFTTQTWYLCLGNNFEMTSTSINYTFKTYGNYYNLYKYVSKIDKNSIF